MSIKAAQVGEAVSKALPNPSDIVEASEAVGDAYPRFERKADGTILRGDGVSPAIPWTPVNGIPQTVGTLSRDGAVFSGSYASLDYWRSALRNVRQGLGNARLLAIGDSTTGGTPTSYIDRMADLWAANRMKEARTGLIWPTNTALHVDPRVVYGAGQANAGAGDFGIGLAGAAFITPGAGGNLDIGPVYCDTWQIWYFDLGVGSFKVWTDAGAQTTVNTVGSGWYNSVTVSAGAVGNHTLHIGVAAGVSTMILAIEPRVGAAGLYVSQAGVGATTSTMWNSIAGGAGAPRVMIGSMTDPDLTIIMLTTGDANTQTSLSAYMTNLDTLVAQQQAQGSVLLAVAPRPSLPGAYAIKYDQYIAALEGIRDTRNVAMVNFAAHFDALPFASYMADTLHPTVDAQGEMALIMAQALMP